MRTIMHVTQCLGGVETYLRSFHVHGAFSAYGRRILVTPEESALSDEWRAAGGEVVILKMARSIHPWSDSLALVALMKLIGKERPEVLHLHSSKAGALGWIAARLCRIAGHATRVVYTPHAYYYLGANGTKRSLFLWIERRSAGLTDMLMATSASEAKRSVEEVGYRLGKFKVVANGVEVGDDLPTRLQDADGQCEVIFVGRICFQKNIDMLARVIVHFSPVGRVSFRIIGVGHYPADGELLERMFEAHGVDCSIVEVIPWLPREAVLVCFESSDLCVVTSRYESFGYVAAEAAAAGLPVVATDVDGLRDIVLDGRTGFLAGAEDVPGFVNRIRVLLADRELGKRMGVEGRQRIRDCFAVERNAQLMSSVYSGT
ncbi:MAG: O-antigen biosynthesis glycosyltransferase WbnH [Stenotrophomonas maltophilia]|uniref:O-antigen biosynthesis glycosyltransferase WbnH n=1 Tax=Stenotrophomonas maltophilia TaxID=40324 RepID=A0A7V8FJP6_STEMA|nr:MAG: O-antigen biosynthesis glycosyltransferase WbnH [Stenotrophomonas maltophilia]